MACTARGTSPWPVISSTGSSASWACNCSSNCRPSIPGMRMSLTTTPGQSRSMRAATPWAWARGRIFSPARSSVWPSAWRRCGSSSISTTWILLSMAWSVLMRWGPLEVVGWRPVSRPAGALSARRRPGSGWPGSIHRPGHASRYRRSPTPGQAPGYGSWS
ncbi:hypothetical protein D9M71_162760 [compost metagenome]